MDKDLVIKVDNVSKKFSKSIRRSMFNGSKDIFLSMLGLRMDTTKLRRGEFWSLQNINFELKRGEALGIVGRNGSGKSTLLRLLTGIYPPDVGTIAVRGKLGALIAVGAGFHPHMTGKENIYLNAAILGLTKKQIDEKYNEIVDFADIGDFLEAPVSTYSSGMNVRLGFSIAIHTVPEILLIDEVLAVGDMRFQQKCMAKIGEIIDKGTSIILVSHDMKSIQRICSKVLVINNGKQYFYGDVVDGIDKYYELNSEMTEVKTFVEGATKLENHGSVTCKYLKFYNGKGEETRNFKSGDDIIVKFQFNVPVPIKDVSAHVSFSDGPYTFNGYSTVYDNIPIPLITSDTEISLRLKNVVINGKKFIVSIGLWDDKFIGSYFWDYESTGVISIDATKKIHGRFEFSHEWEIK